MSQSASMSDSRKKAQKRKLKIADGLEKFISFQEESEKNFLE